MDLHRLAERRSLAYHEALASRLTPEMVERARARVEAWSVRGLLHARYADAWRALLAKPLDELARALVVDTDEMTAVRSTSPFAGELDPRERWRLWREVGAREA